MADNGKRYDKELYEWYKEHGICVQCGANDAAPNRVRCEECLAKNAECSRKRRAAMTYEEYENLKERKRQSQKISRQKLKAKGLCIDCGKPICSRSSCHCIDCFLKNKRRDEKRKYECSGGIDRSERPLYGRCYICNKPIEGGKLCDICKARSISYLPKQMNGTLKGYHKKENAALFGKGV